MQQPVKLDAAYHIVGRIAAEAQIVQHHLHVLLDPEQLLLQLRGVRRVVRLQDQPHRGDGRFYLVRPERVVVEHILHLQVGLAAGAGAVGADRAHKLLIIRLDEAVRLGQAVGGGKYPAELHLNIAVALREMPQVDRRGGKLQYREQQQHISRQRSVCL